MLTLLLVAFHMIESSLHGGQEAASAKPSLAPAVAYPGTPFSWIHRTPPVLTSSSRSRRSSRPVLVVDPAHGVTERLELGLLSRVQRRFETRVIGHAALRHPLHKIAARILIGLRSLQQFPPELRLPDRWRLGIIRKRLDTAATESHTMTEMQRFIDFPPVASVRSHFGVSVEISFPRRAGRVWERGIHLSISRHRA